MATVFQYIALGLMSLSLFAWLATLIRFRKATAWLTKASDPEVPLAPWGLVDVIGFLILQVFLNVLALSIALSFSTSEPRSTTSSDSNTRNVSLARVQTEDDSQEESSSSTRGDLAQQESSGEANRDDSSDSDFDLQLRVAFVAGSNLLSVILFSAWLFIRFRMRLQEYGIRLQAIVWDGGIGLLTSIMVLPPIVSVHAMLSQWVSYTHQTKTQLESSPTVLMISVSFFSAGLVAPIVEEFFYRLIFQGWMIRFKTATAESLNLLIFGGRDRWQQQQQVLSAKDEELLTAEQLISKESSSGMRRWVGPAAILLSASFFSFMHLGQGLAFIPIFLLGLALGIVFEKTKRILPCLVVHLLLNIWSLSAITFQSLSS